MMIKLGVNVDHVATIREARGGLKPSPVCGALEAQKGGADGITVHLREDRRHIQEKDVWLIRKKVNLPLNLEMALDQEIVGIALKVRPDKICLVPEKRRELTTEGGLDVCAKEKQLKRFIPRFHHRKIEVSLFIDPASEQIMAASRVGADAVEIHTGAYSNAKGVRRQWELVRIKRAVELAAGAGLNVHAGHGLDYDNVRPIAKIPLIKELNIGHAIVSHAMVVGMRRAVSEMKKKITRAQA